MVLMMVNLFTLIKYAAGMEATRNITPGLEPDDDKVGTNWILTDASANRVFTCSL